MLKGIDPILTPELLMRLSAMGHGEWVALALVLAAMIAVLWVPRPVAAPSAPDN